MRIHSSRPWILVVLLSALLYGATSVFAMARAADLPVRAPHIALILPLATPAFARHAEAVRQGFFAAAKLGGKEAIPVRVYSVNEDTLNVLSVYEQAIEAGASLIVGPLTRTGVATLAASQVITVPTLALNQVETGNELPVRLHLFGLGVEAEAQQVARWSLAEGRRQALVVSDDSLSSKRMRQAFVEEFVRRGGTIAAELAYGLDPVSLDKLRSGSNLEGADMTFLALDYQRAAMVRSYFSRTAAYATSQVNTGAEFIGRELDRVRFVDMPWVLQPQHAAVMIYPRPRFETLELERLYALGIDAFRIALEVFGPNPAAQLDGVTGLIRLGRDRRYVRELLTAQFIDGKAVDLSARR